MRYGIFGDVHSNIEAFEAVLSSYKKEDIDKFLCVGDIVGYGADPHRCIEELKKLKAETVCGNHDWASVGIFDTEYFNYAARAAVKWTHEILTPEEEEFLKNLRLIIEEENFNIVHGSLDRPDHFNYVLDTISALNCFRNMQKDLCFVGHSHVAGVFLMEGDEINYSNESFIKIKTGVKYIINVGSVGQPRDYNPLAAYSIFDSDKMTVEIKRIDYDTEGAKNKILKAHLPEVLGYRLLEGR